MPPTVHEEMNHGGGKYTDPTPIVRRIAERQETERDFIQRNPDSKGTKIVAAIIGLIVLAWIAYVAWNVTHLPHYKPI